MSVLTLETLIPNQKYSVYFGLSKTWEEMHCARVCSDGGYGYAEFSGGGRWIKIRRDDVPAVVRTIDSVVAKNTFAHDVGAIAGLTWHGGDPGAYEVAVLVALRAKIRSLEQQRDQADSTRKESVSNATELLVQARKERDEAVAGVKEVRDQRAKFAATMQQAVNDLKRKPLDKITDLKPGDRVEVYQTSAVIGTWVPGTVIKRSTVAATGTAPETTTVIITDRRGMCVTYGAQDVVAGMIRFTAE